MPPKIEEVHTKNPIQEGDYLWKYLSFYKFLSFIVNKRFFYSRLDKLEDAFEGIQQKHLALLSMRRQLADDGVFDPKHPMFNKLFFGQQLKEKRDKLETTQKSFFVNCWITNNRESAAMWNLYSEPGGVALKVRASDLIKFITSGKYSFDSDNAVLKILYGKVKYRDFLNVKALDEKAFTTKYAAFRKDISFKHEQEFRVALQLPQSNSISGMHQTFGDADELNYQLVCHPKTQQWQKDVLSRFLQGQKVNKPVTDSELSWR